MSREWVDSGDRAAFDQSFGVVVDNPDLANEVIPGKRENEEVAARFMYLDPRDPVNSYYHFKYARMSGSRAAARTVDELNKQLASSVPFYVPSTVRLVIGALVLLAGFFLCILHDKKISQLLTGVALLVAGPLRVLREEGVRDRHSAEGPRQRALRDLVCGDPAYQSHYEQRDSSDEEVSAASHRVAGRSGARGGASAAQQERRAAARLCE